MIVNIIIDPILLATPNETAKEETPLTTATDGTKGDLIAVVVNYKLSHLCLTQTCNTTLHVAEMGLRGNKRWNVHLARIAKSEQSGHPVKLMEYAYPGCMPNVAQVVEWKLDTYLLTQTTIFPWSKQSLSPFLRMSSIVFLSS